MNVTIGCIEEDENCASHLPYAARVAGGWSLVTTEAEVRPLTPAPSSQRVGAGTHGSTGVRRCRLNPDLARMNVTIVETSTDRYCDISRRD